MGVQGTWDPKRCGPRGGRQGRKQARCPWGRLNGGLLRVGGSQAGVPCLSGA